MPSHTPAVAQPAGESTSGASNSFQDSTADAAPAPQPLRPTVAALDGAPAPTSLNLSARNRLARGTQSRRRSLSTRSSSSRAPTPPPNAEVSVERAEMHDAAPRTPSKERPPRIMRHTSPKQQGTLPESARLLPGRVLQTVTAKRQHGSGHTEGKQTTGLVACVLAYRVDKVFLREAGPHAGLLHRQGYDGSGRRCRTTVRLTGVPREWLQLTSKQQSRTRIVFVWPVSCERPHHFQCGTFARFHGRFHASIRFGGMFPGEE